MSDLPPGFVLDKPAAQQPQQASGGLPPGFVLDQKAAQPQAAGGLDSLWEGIKNFGAGVGRGVAGQGVPAGKASEDPGGRSEFGGRMVGAAGRSVAQGLWDAISKPGKIAAGDAPFNPADRRGQVEQALPSAMLMAGQGGRRPMVTEATGEPSAIARTLQSQAGAQPNPFVPTAGGRAEPPPGVPVGGAKQPAVPGQPQIRQQPTSAPIPGGAGQSLPPSRPATPALPGGRAEPTISDATTSPLAGALAANDGAAVDQQLSRSYRAAVRPGMISRPSSAGLNSQDQRILTAVDQIIANRPNLKLTDASGSEMTGQLPRSLRQFSEAIDQTKRSIFQQYDQRAQMAGGAGVQVDLAPVVAKLREVAQSPEVVDFHPAVAADAERLAQTMEARRSYTPSEAQDVVQNLNKTLAGFWRNPDHETVSRTTLLAPISKILREQLDKAITSAGSPEYQALRNQYGALRSVEKDVASAVQRHANRVPGGLPGMFGDLAATEEILRGVVTLNPMAVGRGVTIKAAQRALKFINDPNRAIGRMFERRADRSPTIPFTARTAARQPYDLTAGLGAGYAGSAAALGTGLPSGEPRTPRPSAGAE